MGNEHSTASGARCDGVPFVSWKPAGSASAFATAASSFSASFSAPSSAAASPRIPDAGGGRLSISSTTTSTKATPHSQTTAGSGHDEDDRRQAALASRESFQSSSGTTFHFAEPASYRYDKVPRAVSGRAVFTRPPKADAEIVNKSELVGSIAIVERGGRVHFPDIVRRVLAAGAIGIVFIEHTDNKTAMQSLFDGFHSSGRQSVAVPILLLSKFHADQLLADKPSRLTVLILPGDQAIKHIVPDDVYFAVATAARAGEVELLKHLLYSDTSGSVLEHIPKAVALCDAAENGHVDCLEILHGFGISLDEQKPNGTSALMMACSVGNVEAARALLMFGAALDLEDVHGMTALMIAARDGKASCLKLLIRKGARINLSRNRNRGTTALHIAARGGLEECVSILLEAGAALDVQSPNSTTALMEAARAGNLGCVKLLVYAGASLTSRDREGHTAESLARISGHTEIEDFLREQAESESVKDHRRQIEETVARPNSTLLELLLLAKENDIAVDVLKREITHDTKASAWLEQPRIIYEVFRLLTLPVTDPSSDQSNDPVYGKYKLQHFCCEIALWYTRKIFQKNYHPGGVGWSIATLSEELDLERSAGYFKVLFNFVCNADQLDDVLLIMFCKVLNHYILNEQVGGLLWRFFASEGKFIVPWLVVHIGLDSIRDTVVWLLYSDLSEAGQLNVRKSGIFESMFARLYSWQRTLSWGVGTSYQRDSIENICLLINYIIYPPSVYVMNNVATFVENTDHSLPLITDQYFPNQHNELLKSLLLFLLQSPDFSFGTMIDLGFSEIYRQSTQDCKSLIIHEGGALSIVMMMMSTLGYHKRKRDLTGIDSLLKDTHVSLLTELIPRVEKFVKLCRAVVMSDVTVLRGMTNAHGSNVTTVKSTGSALLYIITFLKRCVFLQSGKIDGLLAQFGLMPCFLACYGSHPNNSLLHHELTDVIRFVLLDPDQKRLPSCPLLNGLFIERASILDFVIRSYESRVQYKGHMTTIANSIFTLTNTPNFKSSAVNITCQEVVRQYTNQHEKWRKFESTLAEQNVLEMRPLGQRHAPLCDGCLKLKEHAVEYVTSTFASTDVKFSGYLETIFSGGASHYCKVNYTDDFITGFMYKKDKIHDHIPIPEPTRVSSFIQFPVPMPFHALTFTITYVGLCLKCDKLWYCDTLQSANWTTRMKWVIPTSARKWYSFGVTEGPGSGAHGIQFSTKGYKNFIVICDTWGRQEQWMRAIDEAILGLASQSTRRIDPAHAMAIEIDNEVDTDEFDVSVMRAAVEAETGAETGGTSPQQAIKSEGRGRPKRAEENQGIRRRSNTISSSLSDLERVHREFTEQDRTRSTTSEQSERSNHSEKASAGTRAAAGTSPPHSSRNVNLVASSSPPKHGSSQQQKRNLDLKKFQPDTRKFSEILNNLKITSPPRVNVEAPVAMRHQIPPTPPASSSAKLPTMLSMKVSADSSLNRNSSSPSVTASMDDGRKQRRENTGGTPTKGSFDLGLALLGGGIGNPVAIQLAKDRNAMEPLGMRHVVSTPNLTQLS
uniref:PA domain-containing protein n=1 Tax=Globisporangium ultimum (strain ATCC 200006 / CBS 805.95 / DAOM BR144) TaxID=431595 RepID=K3WBN8_GLOUD